MEACLVFRLQLKPRSKSDKTRQFPVFSVMLPKAAIESERQ